MNENSATIYPKSAFFQFSPDSQRIVANLELAYDAWLTTAQELSELPVSMFWAARGDAEYLAVKVNSADSGTTRGRRSADTEAQLAKFTTHKTELTTRIASLATVMEERARLYRTLSLPVVPDQQGEILRALDVAGKLSTDLMVVGTNAFIAYEIVCGARFPVGNEETEDFDLAWCRDKPVEEGEKGREKSLLSILRSIDSTFVINRSKPYQAVNQRAYEVELLAAPSRHPLPKNEPFSPMASLVEQEWLLKGRPVTAIAATTRNRVAPLCVPDPRWMAVHKLWLSEKPDRKAAKRPKDARQGAVLLDAVRYFMPHSHPLGTDFVLDLPEELRPHFDAWARARGFIPGADTD